MVTYEKTILKKTSPAFAGTDQNISGKELIFNNSLVEYFTVFIGYDHDVNTGFQIAYIDHIAVIVLFNNLTQRIGENY